MVYLYSGILFDSESYSVLIHAVSWMYLENMVSERS